MDNGLSGKAPSTYCLSKANILRPRWILSLSC